ncbi:MAG: NRDE family protein [Steroidobacteraceae bacterium]|jgi:uncharacterized protein with NRDE domain|nr:NRDE family protein [Steroidobacteraceae bacterium]
MCLLVVAWRAHPRYRVVVAANRDEFHARPTAPMAPWSDGPPIIAGRDLQAGGTWIGVDARRRFGLVTNFRELARPRHTAPSRGRLVPGFLAAPLRASTYLDALGTDAQGYAGFNLLLGDDDELVYGSNRAERFATVLQPGLHGLSNHLLDTPWPKLRRVRGALQQWIARATAGADDAGWERESADAEWLMRVFADRERAAAPHDPSSGLSPEWERTLSAPFVLHPDYGTRCTTVLLVGHDGRAWLGERRFGPDGRASGQSEWRLNAGEWPLAGVAGVTPPPGNPSGAVPL